MPGSIYANPFDTPSLPIDAFRPGGPPVPPRGLPGVGGLPGGLGDYYLNATPEAAFWTYLQNAGYGGSTRPVDRYAQQQQGRVYSRYQTALPAEPNLGFWDYLKRERPNFQADYMDQSPTQRGDTSDRFLTPRARFVNAY